MKKEIITQGYIVRHGQPDYQLNEIGERKAYGPEIGLSPTGIRQIEELALRMPKLESIYSSTLVRAIETAKIIVDKRNPGLKIKEEPNLIDIIGKGAVGLPLDKLGNNEIISKMLPGDETMEDLEKRVLPAFEKILENENEKTFVVVSHGHSIRLIVLRLLEKYEGELPRLGKLQNENYLNPGEAWWVRWDKNNQLIDYQIMARPETKVAGRREDVKFDVNA